MPKTSENPLHLYWDKALLLFLAAIGVYVFMAKVLSSPVEIKNPGGSASSPASLAEEVGDLADKLKRELGRTDTGEQESPSYSGPVDDFLNQIPSDLPQNALAAEMPGQEDLPTPVEIATPAVLSPLNLQAKSGIGLVSTKSRYLSQQEMSWVTVAGKFPFIKQYLVFAGINPRLEEKQRLPENDRFFVFARLEMERQEQQAGGKWSKAQPVNPYEAYRARLSKMVEAIDKLYSLSDRLEGPQNARTLRDWLARAGFQEFIVRPEFFELESFEQWYWPDSPPDESEDRKDWLALAGIVPNSDSQPRYTSGQRTTYPGSATTPPGSMYAPGGAEIYGGPVYGGPVPPAGNGGTRSFRPGRAPSGRVNIPRKYTVEDPGTPEFIDIWAHDTSAEPGKTYRYRLRVVLFNPLCGSLRAESRQVHEQAWLTGPWSDWSEPVQVMEKRYFFFNGISRLTSLAPRARVMIYAFDKGFWYGELFSYDEKGVQIGSSRDVPAYGEDEPRGVPKDAPARRPKITIDFTTDWTILDFTAEVKFDADKGVPDESGSQVADELEVKNAKTGEKDKRYSILDKDNARRQLLEEIIKRQKKAFEKPSRLPGSTRPGGPPDGRPPFGPPNPYDR